MVESSPVVHAPLSFGCPSMRVCSMVVPLAFRLEADLCTEQPTTLGIVGCWGTGDAHGIPPGG